MKLRTIIYIVLGVIILLLATCGGAKLSQYLKDKHTAETTHLESNKASADSNVIFTKAEYRLFLSKLDKAIQSKDSAINVLKLKENKAKTSVIKTTEYVNGLSPEQVNNKIDSIKELHASELLADFLTERSKDAQLDDCEQQNELLTKEVADLKKVPKEAEKVIVADSTDQKADDALIKNLGKKHPLKDLLKKAGVFIVSSVATIETAILGAEYLQSKK